MVDLLRQLIEDNYKGGYIYINVPSKYEYLFEALKDYKITTNIDLFKEIDIIIENVSLAQTARSEYTAYIKQSPNGVDGLIKDLRARLK